MKTDIRTLITDIKAAARIGHAESLWVALDGILDFPEVAGNPQMSEAFIKRAILTIGEALAQPRLSANLIRPLGNEPFAALRAITATASPCRFKSWIMTISLSLITYRPPAIASGAQVGLCCDCRQRVYLATRCQRFSTQNWGIFKRH